MNIKEFRNYLKKFDLDAKVMITWEGIFRDVKKDNIYKAPNGTIIIDADDNLYKKDILSGDKKVWEWILKNYVK